MLHGYSSKTATGSLRQHLSVHNISVNSRNENKKQLTIAKMFSSASGFGTKNAAEKKTDADLKFQITRELAIVSALDFSPFTMVQNTGFQLFCTWHGIDTKTLPDPRNITNVGLADVYNFCIDQLKKMIKEAPNHAALLMDCSTDNFRRRAQL
jgi:hypothetical protein